MKNYFLLEDIILEGRLEDAKKKYSNLDPNFIDTISQRDPSGDNKYLDWMLNVAKAWAGFPDSSLVTRYNDMMINTVTDFHNNLNKITPELIDELDELGELGRGDHPAEVKRFEKLRKAPKDIKSYPSLTTLDTVAKAAKSKLSKAEVKKLNIEVLLNTSDLLVLIPKSHETSCYYGAGTRWCTTQKDPSYYNRYMGRGVLIYVISKKEKSNNRWYKTAFFIDRTDGSVSAFDAPDKPSTVKEAKEGLGKYWVAVRDTIVDYLYSNNYPGIDQFYDGQELLSWLESKGVDILNDQDLKNAGLTKKSLIQRIGIGVLNDYLIRRKVDPFTYFSFPEIMAYKLKEPNSNFVDIMRDIWFHYIEIGINPLSKIVEYNSSGNLNLLSTVIGSKGISVDSFLEQSISFKVDNSLNIFDYLSMVDQNTLMDFFGGDFELIFNFAKALNYDLLKKFNYNKTEFLLNKRFNLFKTDKDINDFVNFILKNNPSNVSVTRFDIDQSEITSYLIKENKFEQLNELIDRNILGRLNFNDFIKIYGQNEDCFWRYYSYVSNDMKSRGRFDDLSLESPTYIKLFFNDRSLVGFNKIFPTMLDFIKSFQKKFNKSFEETLKILDFRNRLGKGEYQSIMIGLNENVYENDSYKMYLDFKKSGLEEYIDTVVLVRAYAYAPSIEIQEEMEPQLHEALKKSLGGSLHDGGLLSFKDGKAYVSYSYDGLDSLSNLFYPVRLCKNILSGDLKLFTELTPIFNINELIEPSIKKLIIDHLKHEYLNEVITVSMDVIDTFPDEFVLRTDREYFEVRLTNRVFKILEEDETYLINLLGYSPDLEKLKKAIIIAYRKAQNSLVLNGLRNFIFEKTTSYFGGDFKKTSITQRGIKTNIQEFEYTYFYDDVITFYTFHNDDFNADNITKMLKDMMYENIGRFGVDMTRLDIDDQLHDLIDEYRYDFDFGGQEFINDFREFIYDKLLSM